MTTTTPGQGRTRFTMVMVAATLLAVHALNAQQPAPASAPGASPAPAPPAAVEVAAVRRDYAAETLRVVGSLFAGESVTLRPEVAGRIASIEFDEGQDVDAGQVLVTLDPAESQAQVASSEAATRLWELKFERARDLLGRKVMSQQEYDETQSTLKEARARLALERVRLDKTVIRSPLVGTVGLRQVSVGDYVEEGDVLVNIEAIDPVKVDINVPERYAASVSSGQTFTISVAAYPDRQFRGEVYAIDPRLDEAGRTLRVRGRIVNTDKVLKPGMFAQVEMVLAARANALWIPEESIVPRGAEQFVFRIEDDRAVLTRVAIGQRRVGEVEIREGLHEGDTVVTAGHTTLRDQASVRIVNLPPAAKPDV